MIDILIAIAFLLFFTYVMYVEYKNPLWNEFVSRGADIPKVNGNQHSIEMVFFWKNCSTYKESAESDYWNSMAVYCLEDGILIKRPFFLFGRRSVFFQWSQIEVGSCFRKWMAKRREIHIKDTHLYLSISDKVYQRGLEMVKDGS